MSDAVSNAGRGAATAARRFACALVVAVASTSATAADVTLLCAGAMKAPVTALLTARAPSQPRVEATYATAGAIRERLAAGERFDVVIAPADVVATLADARAVDPASRRPLGTTEVGVAVRAGAPIPDIATPAALRDTLLAARKVVIVDPTKGTSGRLVHEVFDALQIRAAMRERTIELDGGYVVEAVARGEADVGLHQISEILPVAGVVLVGPLPEALRRRTRYDVASLASSEHRADGQALIDALVAPGARAVLERHGFVATP